MAPGGNITGLSSALEEGLPGKWVELLKEAVPKVSRVAVLLNPASPIAASRSKEVKTAAQALGVQLQPLEVAKPEEFDGAFAAMATGRAGALIVIPDPLMLSHPARIADLAARGRLPTVSGFREFVDAGGLMAYGPDLPGQFRRAAYYVDKILKGGNPATLPVEQGMRFELDINLKTAKALGLTIPQSLLLRADEVIQ